jgi:hypothetical protein
MEKIMENRTMLSTIELVNLSKGKFAIIDIEESDLVNQYKWCINDKQNNNYAIATKVIDNIRHSKRMHRVIMRVTDPSIIIDHINHNGLDNRRCNLRITTHQKVTVQSQVSNNKNTKHKGISFHKPSNKWRARISINGKTTYLGYYINEIEAAYAYEKKAIELYGEFAHITTYFDK